MKKKVIILLLIIILAGGAGAGGWYYYNQNHSASDTENAVFVDNVGKILGITSFEGGNNRFAGVVEPQKTESIQLANGMKVKKNYVVVGDEVKIGDKLFEYDTEDAQDSITQLEIDIENADITIESAQHQVEELTKLKNKASENDKLSYTTQIMTTENSIKRSEYEKKSKQAEMESLKKQIANAVVYSEFQGIVKSINASMGGSDDTSAGFDGDENNSGYMTIMSTGEYRIKGSVNEQNMSEIQIGTPVLVYSRVDESKFWRGVIGSIDKEHGKSNSNSMFGSDDSMTNSSSYPFYVELESSVDLMLGQHVFVVKDIGQESVEGIWLEDYYFIPDSDGNPTNYVWVADDKDKLVKRELELGEYDEEFASYEVLGGLTADDYIAFPDASYEEGMSVTKNEEVDYSSYDDGMGEEFFDGGDYIDGEDPEDWDESWDEGSDGFEDEFGEEFDDELEDGGDIDDEIEDGDFEEFEEGEFDEFGIDDDIVYMED